MLQNYAWIKDSFKVGDKPIDFNAAESEKFTGMISDFTLQLIIRKLPLVEFAYDIKEDYHNYLKNFLK